MPDAFEIRDYDDSDADSWLRCRLLSFFTTQYYDDVVIRRPTFENPSVRLVALNEHRVVGLLDAEVFGSKATIDVLAVHPDHQRHGIATELLHTAVDRLKGHHVETLDAWTREDPPANGWYLRSGFTLAFRYVHIHKTGRDDASGFETPEGMSPPIHAFMHAPIEWESAMRERFRRVYVCRQYVRPL